MLAGITTLTISSVYKGRISWQKAIMEHQKAEVQNQVGEALLVIQGLVVTGLLLQERSLVMVEVMHLQKENRTA
jgi:formate/nitrite transporter FocA (FNT family)